MAIYSPARQYPVAAYNGYANNQNGCVFHVQVGYNPIDWIADTSHGASYHLWFPQSGENPTQYVDTYFQSWSAVNGNTWGSHAGIEGYPNEAYGDELLQRLAEFYAWGHQTHGWPLQITDDPNGYGMGTHSMGGAAWGGHDCPGSLRASQRPEILARAIEIITPTINIQQPERDWFDMATEKELENIVEKTIKRLVPDLVKNEIVKHGAAAQVSELGTSQGRVLKAIFEQTRNIGDQVLSAKPAETHKDPNKRSTTGQLLAHIPLAPAQAKISEVNNKTQGQVLGEIHKAVTK